MATAILRKALTAPSAKLQDQIKSTIFNSHPAKSSHASSSVAKRPISLLPSVPSWRITPPTWSGNWHQLPFTGIPMVPATARLWVEALACHFIGGASGIHSHHGHLSFKTVATQQNEHEQYISSSAITKHIPLKLTVEHGESLLWGCPSCRCKSRRQSPGSPQQQAFARALLAGPQRCSECVDGRTNGIKLNKVGKSNGTDTQTVVFSLGVQIYLCIYILYISLHTIMYTYCAHFCIHYHSAVCSFKYQERIRWWDAYWV